jgi:hypothetical protein
LFIFLINHAIQIEQSLLDVGDNLYFLRFLRLQKLKETLLKVEKKKRKDSSFCDSLASKRPPFNSHTIDFGWFWENFLNSSLNSSFFYERGWDIWVQVSLKCNACLEPPSFSLEILDSPRCLKLVSYEGNFLSVNNTTPSFTRYWQNSMNPSIQNKTT